MGVRRRQPPTVVPGTSWPTAMVARGGHPDAFRQELAAEIDVVERVRARYPAGTRLRLGAPTRCPRCGEYGLVDGVDVVAGRSDHRCLHCGSAWVISDRALLAVYGDPPARGSDVSSATQARIRWLEARLAPTADLPGVRFSRTAEGQVQREPVAASLQPLPPPAAPGPARVTPSGVHPVRLVTPGLPLRVLLVEGDPTEVQIVRSLIDPVGPDVVDLRMATTRAAGEIVARVSPSDVVLLDLGLPDSTGVDTLTHWHARVGDAPVLLLGSDPEVDLVAHGDELGVAGVLARAELVRYLEQGDAGRSAFLDLLEISSGALAIPGGDGADPAGPTRPG